MAPWWRPAAALVCLTGLLLLVTAAALWRSLRLSLPCLALLWVALGWTCAELHPVPVPEPSLTGYADGLSRDVEGQMTRIHELPSRGEQASDTATAWEERTEAEAAGSAAPHAYSVDLAVERIEEVTPDTSRMIAAKGGVRVTVYATAGAAIPASCGDHIRVPLRLHLPQRFRDPGVWQYPEYLAGEGISVQANANLPKMSVTSRAEDPPIACKIAGLQGWAAGRMPRLSNWELAHRIPRPFRISGFDAGMLNAMLVGDRSRLSHGLRTQFERTGSFHLFVVAGFHVALVAAMLYWLLRRLRAPEWLATGVALLLVSAFAVVSGFGAPVQRALFMTAVLLLARLLSRESSALNALGAAALAMLALRPAALFEAGFQMTLLVIVAIGGIAIPLCERTLSPYLHATRRLHLLVLDPHLPPHLAQFRVTLRMLGGALVPLFGRHARRAPGLLVRLFLWWCELTIIGLVTEVVMALPMAFYFHRVTPFALPANLLATPVIGLLLGSAIVTFTASLIHPAVALLPGAVTALLLHGLTAMIGRLSHLQGADLRMPAPAMAMVAAALLCWAICLWAVRSVSRSTGAITLVLLPCAFVLLLWPRAPLLQQNRLEFTAIDVGQGDSLLVGSPEGQAMLIDAGGPVGSPWAATASGFDTGEEVVSPYLWSRRLRRLEVLVLTHAHSDHIGGMDAVLRNFRPRELWLSVDADTPALQALLSDAGRLGVRVRHLHAGEDVPWSGVAVRVLSPSASYQPRPNPANDDSLVLRMTYGRASVLAEGDAERPSEAALLEEQPEPVTLLKVGHHGSRSSTMPELLAALRPRAAVISCGKGNRFGHPREEVLARLQEQHTQTWRTDTMGAVQFLLRSDGGIDAKVLTANTTVQPWQ